MLIERLCFRQSFLELLIGNNTENDNELAGAIYRYKYVYNTVYVDNVVLTVHLYIRKKTKPFTDGVENTGYTVHMFGLRTLYSTQNQTYSVVLAMEEL